MLYVLIGFGRGGVLGANGVMSMGISVVHEPARDKPGGKLESARLVRGVGSDCGEISGPGSNGSSRREPVRAK